MTDIYLAIHIVFEPSVNKQGNFLFHQGFLFLLVVNETFNYRTRYPLVNSTLWPIQKINAGLPENNCSIAAGASSQERVLMYNTVRIN